MLKDKRTQEELKEKEKHDKEMVLQEYKCSKRCRVCPFPGAKCEFSSWR